MPNEPRATPEDELSEAWDRLDAVCEKLVLKFGTEAVARLLTGLARKYADVFKAEVTRARDDWRMTRPRGSA